MRDRAHITFSTGGLGIRSDPKQGQRLLDESTWAVMVTKFARLQGSFAHSATGTFPIRVNLAYTCVKPLVRLYVCQRVAFFMTHCGPKKIIFGFILDPFGIHLGKY